METVGGPGVEGSGGGDGTSRGRQGWVNITALSSGVLFWKSGWVFLEM